jgi:PAS domain S-box-containing protein
VNKRTSHRASSARELRRRAESSLPARAADAPVLAGTDRLVHELSVHQIELEMQNEELRASAIELERSRNRYLDIYNLAPVGFLNVDLTGTIREANAAIAGLLGIEPRFLVGRKLSGLVSARDADTLERRRREALARGTAVGCEVALIKRGEGQVPVHARCKAMFEADGSAQSFLYALLDLTELRHAEAELQQAQKMEAVGMLAGAIAHDFGNLLQGILGCALIANSDDVSADRRRDFLDRIMASVSRGSDLVGRLMTFTRKAEVVARPVRFDDIVTGMAVLVGRLVGPHVRLEVRPGAPEGVVHADPVQIEQILLNLAVNARDAMPEGGTLEVATEELRPHSARPRRSGGSVLRLTVRDTGVGIDPATKARIFDPFFTTKPPGQGTGIGLSTVLEITRALGGRVDVDSEAGKGTTFVFHFPCADGELMPAPLPDPDLRFSGRVLLVDDHALSRVSIRHLLEQLGLEVVEAPDATRAAEVAHANLGALALCVCDVTLPDGTGPKLMTRLQAHDARLRTLFISANPIGDLRARGLLDERAPVLQKPFGKRELAAALVPLLPQR